MRFFCYNFNRYDRGRLYNGKIKYNDWDTRKWKDKICKD